MDPSQLQSLITLLQQGSNQPYQTSASLVGGAGAPQPQPQQSNGIMPMPNGQNNQQSGGSNPFVPQNTSNPFVPQNGGF